MSPTTIFGAIVGVYALVTGVIRLISERRAMRQEGRPARPGPVVVGIVGAVLGAVMLIFTGLIDAGVLR